MCCTVAEEDLFNKTNFYLLLFLKFIDSLHLSSEGPKIKVEIQVRKLQKITHDRNMLWHTKLQTQADLQFSECPDKQSPLELRI